MKLPLNDLTNLRILREICDGKGVFINYSYLSETLKRHRNTIKSKVEELIKKGIIDPPIYPFMGNYRVHPVLILLYADLPHDERFNDLIKNDKHIFAAFKIRQNQYNTLLMIYHKNILSYQLWREHLTETGKFPARDLRFASETHFFSNQLVLKYLPQEPLRALKEYIDKKGPITMNSCTIDKFTIDLLNLVMSGKGIRINESYLSKKLDIHKKTIRNRIKLMIELDVLLEPVCRFHNFLIPPDSALQITKVEINENRKDVLSFINNDPHISLAYRINENRYNYLLFETFYKEEDAVEWSSQVRSKYKDMIGDTDTIVLMEKNMFHIDQQKVSLGAIKDLITIARSPENNDFRLIEPGELLFD